jgi:glyoxylase I family protein
MLNKLHHAAYRCADAGVTTDFYTGVLGLELACTLLNEEVGSLGLKCPHVHIFFEMKDGSYIAFFEVPGLQPVQQDPNTPLWVKHLALEVSDMEELLAAKKRIEAKGVEVVGVTDHGIFQSIYFFDPDGHRLEITTRTETPGELARNKAKARLLLNEWVERRRPSLAPS